MIDTEKGSILIMGVKVSGWYLKRVSNFVYEKVLYRILSLSHDKEIINIISSHKKNSLHDYFSVFIFILRPCLLKVDIASDNNFARFLWYCLMYINYKQRIIQINRNLISNPLFYNNLLSRNNVFSLNKSRNVSKKLSPKKERTVFLSFFNLKPYRFHQGPDCTFCLKDILISKWAKFGIDKPWIL